MKTLFIRNLPFDAAEADLRKAFEPYGKVHRCSIAKNRDTGESRGFGFVDLDDDAAPKAIAEMNGRMIAGRSIVVQESDPKTRAGDAGGARPATGPSGARPGSAPGGAGMGSSGPRPGGPPRSSGSGPGGPPRPHGGAPSSGGPGGGMMRSRTASAPTGRPGGMNRTARPAGGGDPNKHFGPNAAPASERLKAYSNQPKDRLKPYKREHFDFRDALGDDEESGRKGRKDDDGDDAE